MSNDCKSRVNAKYAFPKIPNYSFKKSLTPAFDKPEQMRLFPSPSVLSVTYCMPDYGWTHQLACVQTCLVCSLFCNSRVPSAQSWSVEISVAPSENVRSCMIQRLVWEVCWHKSYGLQAPNEISPLK